MTRLLSLAGRQGPYSKWSRPRPVSDEVGGAEQVGEEEIGGGRDKVEGRVRAGALLLSCIYHPPYNDARLGGDLFGNLRPGLSKPVRLA